MGNFGRDRPQGGTEGLAPNTHDSLIVLPLPIRLLGVDDSEGLDGGTQMSVVS